MFIRLATWLPPWLDLYKLWSWNSFFIFPFLVPGSNRRPPSGNGSSVPPVTTSSTSPNVILSTATLATTSQQNSTSPPRRHVSIVSQAQNTLIQGEFRPSPMWEMARIHRWNTSGLFCYYTTSWDITIIFNEDYFNPKQGKI